MSDPLSVAAGIAGLITLGFQITDGFTRYYQAFRDRDENIKRTLLKLDMLSSCLAALSKTIAVASLGSEEKEVARAIHNSIQTCDTLLNKLSAKLTDFHKVTSTLDTKDQPRRKRAKLIYPFQAGTLARLEAEIVDVQERLSFALQVLQIRSRDQVQVDSTSTKYALKNIQDDVSSGIIKSWLNPVDAVVNHNTVLEASSIRKGLWFVNGAQFTKWLSADNSLLCVHGCIGSGKSTLCSSAIHHAMLCKREKIGTGVASYCFGIGENAAQGPSGLLRSLLWQLSHQNASAYEQLKDFHNHYRHMTPHTEVFLDCLKRVVLCFKHVHVFLDALDKCPHRQARIQVLDVLHVVRSWNLPILHLLITSRDEVDIRRGLEASSTQQISMRSCDVDAEIFAYISSRLKSDKWLARWQNYTELIQSILSRQACGMFRWVECQLNALQHCPVSRSHLEVCLGTLPDTLKTTYDSMLSRIDQLVCEDARRILILLCFAKRPLKSSELIDALSVQLKYPERLDLDRRLSSVDEILEICPGLIETSSRGGGSPEGGARVQSSDVVVQFIHWSVKEYLNSDRAKQQSTRFFALESYEANQVIAHICLVYLQGIDPTMTHDADIFESYPFANYAGTFWHDHYISSCYKSVPTDDLVLTLLTDTSLFERWQRCSSYSSKHGSKGPRPLYWAINLGLDEVAERLLTMEHSTIESEFDPLNIGHQESIKSDAVSDKSDMQLKRMLTEFGCSTDGSRSGFLAVTLRNQESEGSPGYYAEIIKLLIRTGATIKVSEESHSPDWLFDQIEEHLMVVHSLIDSGSSRHIVDEYTRSRAIYLAVTMGNVDILPYLKTRPPDCVEEIIDPFNMANTLKSLKTGGYSIRTNIKNSDNSWREAALSTASGRGQIEIVDFLLELGADPNTKGTGSALYEASINGQLKVVQFLLGKGAQVDLAKRSELIAATRYGYTDIVTSLVNANANVHRRTIFGDTALSIAAARRHAEIIMILIEAGVDVDDGSCLALRYASERNYKDIVQALLDAGATPTPWQERDNSRFGERSERSLIQRVMRVRRSK